MWFKKYGDGIHSMSSHVHSGTYCCDLSILVSLSFTHLHSQTLTDPDEEAPLPCGWCARQHVTPFRVYALNLNYPHGMRKLEVSPCVLQTIVFVLHRRRILSVSRTRCHHVMTCSCSCRSPRRRKTVEQDIRRASISSLIWMKREAR